MTLRTRLSIVFVAVVGLILAGFSVTLYTLASRYLNRQADERLEASINMLAAAAEINERGVEWEPAERLMAFNRRIDERELIWTVTDEHGKRIDGSSDRLVRLWPRDIATLPSNTSRAATDPHGNAWRMRFKRLHALPTGRNPTSRSTGSRPPGLHDAMTIGVGVSLAGIRTTMKTLALFLSGLSAGVVLVTLIVGGQLSRRTLRPVAIMAAEAHDIGGDEINRRLPLSRSGDELDELGMAFNGLLDRLQDAYERQKRFTGDASHQLRTPLTAIQGQVDVALRHPRTTEEYQRVLTLVGKRARHLSRIVESMLFLARADAESQVPDLRSVDIHEWIRAYLVTREVPDVAVATRLQVEGTGPFLALAHSELLTEMVDNLLDNAGKYSPAGTTIRIHLSRSRDSILLAIQDQGIGIAANEIPHLFDPFYRSESARSRSPSGQGLGLSVAARLAKIFNATIAVDSTPGHGSTFTIRFPSTHEGGNETGGSEPKSIPPKPTRPGNPNGSPEPLASHGMSI